MTRTRVTQLARNTPWKRRWWGIMDRCYNKNSPLYKYYGGRGIYVCDEWRNNKEIFAEWFVRTIEENKTIDRINNDGPYSPNNCRWATKSEQSKNTRMTNVRISSLKKTNQLWRDKATKKYSMNKLECCLCREFKHRKNFYPNRCYRRGYHYRCIQCMKEKRVESKLQGP